MRTIPESATKTALPEQGGAESGALDDTDPDLELIFHAWPALPVPIKVAILALIRTMRS